jgi:hypothetical protein
MPAPWLRAGQRCPLPVHFATAQTPLPSPPLQPPRGAGAFDRSSSLRVPPVLAPAAHDLDAPRPNRCVTELPAVERAAAWGGPAGDEPGAGPGGGGGGTDSPVRPHALVRSLRERGAGGSDAFGDAEGAAGAALPLPPRRRGLFACCFAPPATLDDEDI